MSHNCWICEDSGIVVYDKLYRGIKYEIASRCICMKGKQMSSSIPTVSDSIAEKIAEENYLEYLRITNS